MLKRIVIPAAVLVAVVAAVALADSRYWDVPLDHDSHDDIIHATDAGWFVGYPDGSFRPDQAMTAEQMTTVFGRAFP